MITAGDSLDYHNGQQFSTKDADNDNYVGTHCSQIYGGGWWYKNCHYSNLNGIYLHQYDTRGSYKEIIWYHWRGWVYSLKATEMKLVPVT